MIGLEILDNMPHDRLHTAQSLGEGSDSATFTHASVVQRSYDEKKSELLSEVNLPIDEIRDPLIDKFLEIWNAQPELDHVTANKRLKDQGVILKIGQALNNMLTRSKVTNRNNIFAPTGAIRLLQQINKVVPNHSLILADFDSFLMPLRGGIKGINSPMVTHKLKDPTAWNTYDSYLCERGHADICFPTDFYFL